MKKYLRIMLMAFLLLPLCVSAAAKINDPVCTDTDPDDNKTCTVTATVNSDDPKLTVTLTEQGGASVESSSIIGVDWDVKNVNKTGDVYTVQLELTSEPEAAGTYTLFKYTYKVSGTPECKVTVSLGKSAPTGKCQMTKDGYFINGEEVTEEVYKAECPTTGATLPYVAVATIAILAAGAFVATKNKAKMYKI